MNEWIVCGLQVTLLGSVTWLIGRLALQRFPELTVTVSLVGLIGGACLVLATLIGVPRIVNLASISETKQTKDAFHANATTNTTVDSTEFANESVTGETINGLGRLAAWLKTSVLLISDSAEAVSEKRSDGRMVFRPAHWFLLIVAIASFLAMLRCLLGIGAAFWFRHVSRTVEDQRILAIRDSVARRMGVTRPVLLRQHARVDSPFVCWLTGWTIFLPAQAENWNEDELSAAMAHELAHLQRCDTWIRFWGELAYTLVAWNPFYWCARHQCLIAQELAADQLVARQLQAGDAYLTGLSRLALRLDEGIGKRFLMPGVCFSNHCLIRRIKMLKCFRMESQSAAGWLNRVTGMVMVLVFLLTGAWTVSAQDEAKNSDSQGKEAASQQVYSLADQRNAQPAVQTIAQTSYEEPGSQLFGRSLSKPWETLGSNEGYFSIRYAELMSHKKLKLFESLIQGELSQILLLNEDGSRRNIADFGLQVSEIELIEFPASLIMGTISKVDESSNYLAFGNSGRDVVRILSANEVDWPGISRVLGPHISAIHPVWGDEEILQKIRQQATYGKELKLSLFDTQTDFPALELTARRQAMWNDVSGGIFSALVPFRCEPSSNEFVKPGDPPFYQHLELLTVKLGVVALGLDFLDSDESETIVVSLEPVEGTSVEELLTVCRDLFTQMINDWQQDLLDQSEPQERAELESYIAILQKVSIDQIGEGDLARVRIQASFPLIQSLIEIK